MSQIFRLMLIGSCLLFFTLSSFAKDPSGAIRFNKPNITTARTLSNIGNWAYWMYDDGQSGIEPDGTSGGFYPRGTSAVIFEDGFVWGGFLTEAATGLPPEQPMRVGGQTYRIGTQPGNILSVGGAADAVENNRIYRIRVDWATLSYGQVAQELAEALQKSVNDVTQAEADDLIEQYRIDWNEWPTEKGAPFIDADSNGTYDPILDSDGNVSLEGDYPGIALADQVVFTVVNDKNPALTNDMYGSQPIGLELQITAWAYNQPGAGLGQLIFKKYKLINKGIYDIDSMYVAQWCDPDVGNAGNDLVGCDTVLSLGYAYNGEAQDVDYQDFELAPSAGGYDFFQGPLVAGKAGQDKNKNGVDDASDYAIFNLQQVGPGYINLPMTSFGYFAAGSPFGEDPELGEYKGSKEWYNLLRGFGTISDDIENPTPFLVGSGPNTGQITKYPMSGDPVNDPTGALGDIDGQGNNPTPADRRMCLATGPFDLPLWDDANGNNIPDFGDAGVQEVVVAIVGGNSGPSSSGNNRLSVAQMKNWDKVAQDLFDDRFRSVPKAPPSPAVKAVAYEKSITLEWGSDPAAVAATEADNPVTGYNFQGYNVYQMPNATASKDDAVLLATFDIIDGVTTIWGKRFDPSKGIDVPVPVQIGNDVGVQRYFTINADAIKGTQIYPGNTYYFSVTAYNYNPAPTLIEDKSLESTLLATVVVPQSTDPGVRRNGTTGELVDYTHTAGVSDGEVFVNIIDPDALTGDFYEVSFDSFLHVGLLPVLTFDTTLYIGPNDTIVVVDTTVTLVPDSSMQLGWNLQNSAGEVLVQNQFIASSNTQPGRARPIVDGFEIVVTGPAPEPKSFEVVANAAGPVDPSEMGTFAFNDNGFPFLFNSLYPEGTDRPDGARQQTNGSTWGVNVGGGANDGEFSTFLARSLRNDNATRVIPYDYEMRFTAAGGYGMWAFTTGAFAPVPFELWNIGINTPDDPSDDYRMIPWVLDEVFENDVYDFGTNNDGSGLDHGVSGGLNDPYMDWVYWIRPVDFSPGTAGYDAFVAAGPNYGYEGDEVWARTVLVNWNGGDCTDPTFPANVDAVIPEEGTIFRIITRKPNTTADVFAFTAPAAPSYNKNTAKRDVDKINVYPNPYYGKNSEETGRFQNFVIFNHLPVNQTVTIRIFALNGVQVRKLEKHEDATANENQFFRWDLTNEAGLPVASGIYIAYIDMPDIGETKVLKVFIVQSAEILQYF